MTGLNVGVNRTFVAGEQLAQFLIVALDTSTENQVLLADTSTDKIAGVVTGFFKDGNTGDSVTVQSKGFSTKIIMSASCSIGDRITATTNGQGITTTTDKDFVVGIALQAAVNAGDIIEVELLMTYLSV